MQKRTFTAVLIMLAWLATGSGEQAGQLAEEDKAIGLDKRRPEVHLEAASGGDEFIKDEETFRVLGRIRRSSYEELARPTSASASGSAGGRRAEPPNELAFSNQTGAVVHCGVGLELAEGIAKAEAASGSGQTNKPLDIQVKWERENGDEIEPTLYVGSSQAAAALYSLPVGTGSAPEPSDQASGQQPERALLRYVRPSDGALVFEPFRPAHFRPEVHAGSYRCVAWSESRGASLVSRDMQLKAFLANSLPGSTNPNQQAFQIEVLDELVIDGNSAQFKCQIPFHAQDYLQVVDWLEYPGETQLSYQTTTLLQARHLFRSPSLKQEQQQISEKLSRYFVAPKTGDLHILNVDMSLNYRAFKCRCRNKLTGELISSSNKGKLIVTESNSAIAPRLVMETSKQILHQEGELALLSCPLQAMPRAQILWHRKQQQQAIATSGQEPEGWRPLELGQLGARGELRYAQVGGILLINRVHRNDSGIYLCQAKNSVGEERLEVELLVRAPLRASLTTSGSVLELGKSLALDCSVSGHPIHQVVFKHNQNIIKSISGSGSGGQQHHYSNRPASSEPPPSPPSLASTRSGGSYFVIDSAASSELSAATSGQQQQQLTGNNRNESSELQLDLNVGEPAESKLSHVIVIVLEPQHAGAYQCFAYNQFESVQSAAYIRVLDDPPKFKETFKSEVYEQRQDISLQCSARANPLPEITWSIDGQQIPESSRIRFGDFVTKDNLVISYVNISQTQVTDSGLYKCVADNGLAQVSHQAQISVLGAIQVKPMANLTVVASTSFRLSCPVAGYPISEIHWEHNNRRLPANHRQQVFENGTLQVEHMEKSQADEGEYVCIATAPATYSTTGSSKALPGQVQTAQGSTFVSIKVRPTIEPFAISRQLREGQRASIMCTISSGDLPISISWFKNEQPLQFLPEPQLPESGSTQPQVHQHHHHNQRFQQTSTNEENANRRQLENVRVSRVSDYSSTLLFESLSVHHSGNYTCLARNDAGSVSHQAVMVVQVAPKWSIEPSDTNIVRGSASTIDCMAAAFPPARIIWSKAGSGAGSGEQKQHSEGAKSSNQLGSWRSIVSSPHLQVCENGSLSVLDARDSDAGHYMCQASNGVGPGLSKVIKVTINVAAQFNTRHAVQYVTRGEQAHLKCQARGDWPLTVHWFKNKNRLEAINLQESQSSGAPPPNQQPSSSTTTLVGPVLLLPGSLLPQASSLSAISHKLKTSSQSVLEQLSSLLQAATWPAGAATSAPGGATTSPNKQQQPGLLMQRYSMAITEVVGAPPEKRTPSSQSSSERLTGGVPVAGQLTSVLSISQAERQDTGSFKCLAANQFGLDERTIQLVVQEPPERVEELSVLEVSSRSITLGWLAPYDGNSPLLNYHVQYRPASQPSGSQPAQQVQAGLETLGWFNLTLAANQQQQTSLEAGQQPEQKRLVTSGGNSGSRSLSKIQVGQLKPMTSYWFRVQAENKLGFGPVSGLLEGATMEEAPGSAPAKLKVVAQSSSSILVSWSKLSEKDSFGSVNGYYVAYKPLLDSNQSSLTNKSHSDQQQEEKQPEAANIYKTVAHDEQLSKFDALLTGLRRSTKYVISVQAYNARGTGPASEPVQVRTLEMDPPRQVKLYVNQASNCSIQLEWRPLSQAALLLVQQNQPNSIEKKLSSEQGLVSRQQVEAADVVDYYSLFMAELNERPRWQEVRLAGHASGQLVEKLRCGTRYQFYMMGVNRIGVGDQSDILDTKTAGGLPLAPDRQSTFDVLNTTCYIVRLDHWQNNGCPIRQFNIRYRPEQAAGSPALASGSRPDWIQLAHFKLPLEDDLSEEGDSSASKQQEEGGSSANKRLKRELDKQQADFYLYPSGPEMDSLEEARDSDEDSFFEYSPESSSLLDYDSSPEGVKAEVAGGQSRQARSMAAPEQEEKSQLLELLKDSMLPAVVNSGELLSRLERTANYEPKSLAAGEWDSNEQLPAGKQHKTGNQQQPQDNWQRVKLCGLLENLYYTVQVTAINSVGETEAELRILTSEEGLEYSQEKKRQVVGRLGSDRTSHSQNIFSDRLSNALWLSDQHQFLVTILLSVLIMVSVIGFVLLKRATSKQHPSGSHTSTTTSTTTSSGSSNHCQSYLNESHAGHQLLSATGSGPNPQQQQPSASGYKLCGPPSAITEATMGSDSITLAGCDRYALAGVGSFKAVSGLADNQTVYGHRSSQSVFEEPAYGILNGPQTNNLFHPNNNESIGTPINSGSPTTTTGLSASMNGSGSPSRAMNLQQQQNLANGQTASTSGVYSQQQQPGRSVYLCKEELAKPPVVSGGELPASVFYNIPRNAATLSYNPQQYQAEQELAKGLSEYPDYYSNQQQVGEQKLDDRFLSIVEEVARANESLAQQQQQATSGKIGLAPEQQQQQCGQPDCSGYHNGATGNEFNLAAALNLADEQNQQQQNRLTFDPVYATIRRTLPQAIRYLTLQQQHHHQQACQSRLLLNQQQELACSGSRYNGQQQQVDMTLFNSANLSALNLLSSSSPGSQQLPVELERPSNETGRS